MIHTGDNAMIIISAVKKSMARLKRKYDGSTKGGACAAPASIGASGMASSTEDFVASRPNRSGTKLKSMSCCAQMRLISSNSCSDRMSA